MRKLSWILLLCLVSCFSEEHVQYFDYKGLSKGEFSGRLVFNVRQNLVVVDLSDRSYRMIRNDLEWGINYRGASTRVSPNGEYILYPACVERGKDRCQKAVIRIVDFDGKLVQDVDFAPVEESINWSNDSRFLVWGVYFDGIYVYELGEVEPERIESSVKVGTYPHEAVFSPDDSKIAFIRHMWNTLFQIDLVDRESGQVECLKEVGFSQEDRITTCNDCRMSLQWFLDGERLFYPVYDTEDAGFYVTGLDKTSEAIVLGDDYDVRYGHFYLPNEDLLSPNGEYFVYYYYTAESSGEYWNIGLFDIASRESRVIFKADESSIHSRGGGRAGLLSLSWSYDSRAVVVYFSSGSDRKGYLAIVDMEGEMYKVFDDCNDEICSDIFSGQVNWID